MRRPSGTLRPTPPLRRLLGSLTAAVLVATCTASFAAVGLIATTARPAAAADAAWLRFLDVRIRDLAYDPVRDVLYASVDVFEEDPRYAGRLLTVDPDTAEVLSVHDVGTGPEMLEVSPDGASLFVGHRPGGTVSRIDLATFTTRWTVALSPGSGNITARDIEVMPGRPTTIAVSRRDLGSSPSHRGIVILDDGVPRPNAIDRTHPLADEIEFDDTGTVLWGSDAGSTGRTLSGYRVDADGLTATVEVAELAGFEIEHHEGRLFVRTGRVVDVSGPTPVTLALHPDAMAITIDAPLDRAYAVEMTGSDSALVAYDTNTLDEVDRWDLPGLRQGPSKMISTGPGRVAFLDGYGPMPLVVADTELGSFGEYAPLQPMRIFDTRDGTGRGGRVGPIVAGETVDVAVGGRGGVPATGVKAVVMNVTAVDPTGTGYVTVFPGGRERPLISSLNTTPGRTVANLVTMPVGADGTVSVYNSSGVVDVLFDVAGYYADQDGPDGMRFHALRPARVMDTRDGFGGPAGGLAPGASTTRTVVGLSGVPRTGVGAVVLNVTVTEPTAPSFLTVWPSGVGRPTVSNLNFRPGDTVANQVVVRLSPTGSFDVFNLAGTAHVVIDVVGWYDDVEQGDDGRFVPFDPFRAIDTRVDSPLPAPGDLWPDDVVYWGQADEWLAAFVLNVTVTDTRGSGYVTAYPYADERSTPPLASTLNYTAGATVPNHAVVRAGPYVGFANRVGYAHLVVDVFGAFI